MRYMEQAKKAQSEKRDEQREEGGDVPGKSNAADFVTGKGSH
jgi:hypothetical protein